MVLVGNSVSESMVGELYTARQFSARAGLMDWITLGHADSMRRSASRSKNMYPGLLPYASSSTRLMITEKVALMRRNLYL